MVRDQIWAEPHEKEAKQHMSSSADQFVVTPIGAVRGGRTKATDDFWGGAVSRIELDEDQFEPAALAEVDSFSHLEVVFHFHKVEAGTEERGARRPRGNPDWPEVGIFAQRAKRRPNRLGVSRCRLLAVDGLVLTVEGLDAIDGTPVVDIKPYLREFAPRGEVYQPQWSQVVMEDYFSPAAPDPDARSQ